MKYYLFTPSGRSFGFELDWDVEVDFNEEKKLLYLNFPANEVTLTIKYKSKAEQGSNWLVDTEYVISEEQIRFLRNNSFNFHQLIKKVEA